MKSIESMVPSLGAVLVAALASPVASSFATQPPAASEVVAKLLAQGHGVEVFDDGERVGVVAIGRASYEVESRDPSLREIAKRWAFVEADLEARRALLAYLEGPDVEARTFLRDFASKASSDGRRSVETETTFDSSVRSVIETAVSAVSTVASRDEADRSRVLVAVALLASDRPVARRQGVRGVDAPTVDDAIARLELELRRGWSPPAGARLVSSHDGERAWISFGSGLVRPGLSGAVRNAAEEAAAAEARSLAEAAMVGAITGETFRSDRETFRRLEAYERAFSGLSGTASEQVDGMNASAESRFDLESVRAGRFPPGANWIELESSDGRWISRIAVIRDRSRAAVRSVPAVPAATDSRSVAAGPANRASVPIVGDCDTASRRSGIERVRANGEGPSREEALRRALLEAVQQVNGALVDASASTRKQFEDAVEDLDGEVRSSVKAWTRTEENIFVASNGMIERFQVLAESRADAGVRVEICADVPVFDPANPRPGKRPTVAVVPFRSIEARWGDKPADVIADPVAATLSGRLVECGALTVLDRRHLDQLDRELASILTMVGDGAAPVQEAAKFGRRLGADYLVVGTLERFDHRIDEVFVKALGRSERRTSFGIGVSAKLVSVADGQVLWQDDFLGNWDGRDLAAAGGGLSPAEFATRSAGGGLGQALCAQVRTQEQARRTRAEMKDPPKVARVRGERIVIALNGAMVEQGDRFEVLLVEEFEFEGRIMEDRVRVAVVVIDQADGGTGMAQASVLEGESSEIAVGSVLQRLQ
jgi:TolB-like protein